MRDILIIQTARLGDLCQTAPLLRGLRREHPQARVTLLVQAGLGSLLDGTGLCDRLVSVPHDDIGALAVPANQEAFPAFGPFAAEPAFREEYDLLVNLSNDPGCSTLCRLIAARRKLGRIEAYAGELRLLGPWSKYLYSMVSHRRENLFNLVDIQVGMAGLPLRPEPRALPATAERRAEARALLAAAGVGTGQGRPLVALQAGASALHRAWSLEHFAALGAGLRDDPGADLVILGDARERERCSDLVARIGGPGVADLSGRTDLPQLQAVLAECDLLVSNDTGSIHVAAAAGTPTLGLYFSTAHYAETAPYGAGHAVLQVEIACAPCDASRICPEQKCRDFLPPGPVLATARWLLAGAPADAVPSAAPNVSLYRSRFLADGSLAYLPARMEASAPFQEALLGRLLWQEELGLSGDSPLNEWLERVRGEGPFRGKRESLAAALAALEQPVRKGWEAAGALRAEFASALPDRERVLSLHRDLADLGKALAETAKPAGLCGAFLHFEMMDMDYAAYPELAGMLEGKYAMLAGRIARLRAALERMA